MQTETISSRPFRVVDCHIDTHIGYERKNNEDSVYADQKAGLFLLADGMGGHEGGEVASSVAVQEAYKTLRRSGLGLDPVMSMTRVFRSASDVVLAMSRNDPGLYNMGTTLIVAALKGSQLWVAHVGDSRVYMRRGNTVYRVTEDHVGPYGGIERAIGCSPMTNCTPDVKSYAVHHGDMMILCSDGLSGPLGGTGISQALVGTRTCKQASDALIGAALAAGGPDNVTVAIARIG